LVGVGFVLDYAVATVGGQLGIRLEISCLVSTAVVFWLVANEIISILENISDIGTPLPPFLMELVQLLKSKTEDSVTFQGEDVGE
ncbi:MAG: phage holin family protein, partial [Oscillospiraceae bacterium]